VREAALPDRPGLSLDAASLLACLATILELPVESLPDLAPDALSRWLGGLRLGLVPIADPASFSWPGPWIARTGGRHVVMFGVPSGVVWDPVGGDVGPLDAGFLVAAADIALAMPPRTPPPATAGIVETIAIAERAGAPVTRLETAHLRAGLGVAGDRHVVGTGTFPTGLPGSALTLIEAEVCESFDPPLTPDEHRRNLVTRGIELGGLVGVEFRVGEVRCRGVRLCEPCTVVQRYAGRPVLRALVHRGGLRADITGDGEIRVGDRVLPA
jgi:MOSC domain-containing protein YiiM